MNRKTTNLAAALTILTGGLLLSSPARADESALDCGLQLIIDVASAICGDQSARITNIQDGPDGCSFTVECF